MHAIDLISPNNLANVTQAKPEAASVEHKNKSNSIYDVHFIVTSSFGCLGRSLSLADQQNFSS